MDMQRTLNDKHKYRTSSLIISTHLRSMTDTGILYVLLTLTTAATAHIAEKWLQEAGSWFVTTSSINLNAQIQSNFTILGPQFGSRLVGNVYSDLSTLNPINPTNEHWICADTFQQQNRYSSGG